MVARAVEIGAGVLSLLALVVSWGLCAVSGRASRMEEREEEWDCPDCEFTSFGVLVGDPSAP